ncbi:IS5 family transposase [Nonomuraea sp. NPDC048881]|uniref:IS5 family transposase n=1 Tax=Nonomuraea sp. NPDC048881 TaxID=3155030 RepID=UPI0033C9A5AA
MTDAQWDLITPLLPEPNSGGRPEKPPRREIVNAILYVVRSACPWRYLPTDLPPRQTVYRYFQQWEQAGVTEALLRELRIKARRQDGRDDEPSAGIIDSRSVKDADTVGRDSRGHDAGKTVNGRKRFIITDTTGLLVTVAVMAASRQDRDGAKTALLSAYLTTPIRHVFADQGFAGRLVDWVRDTLRTRLEIVRKPADQRGSTTHRTAMGGGEDTGLADRLSPSGPRLRTRPEDLRGRHPLGCHRRYGPPSHPHGRRSATSQNRLRLTRTADLKHSLRVMAQNPTDMPLTLAHAEASGLRGQTSALLSMQARGISAGSPASSRPTCDRSTSASTPRRQVRPTRSSPTPSPRTCHLARAPPPRRLAPAASNARGASSGPPGAGSDDHRARARQRPLLRHPGCQPLIWSMASKPATCAASRQGRGCTSIGCRLRRCGTRWRGPGRRPAAPGATARRGTAGRRT